MEAMLQLISAEECIYSTTIRCLLLLFCSASEEEEPLKLCVKCGVTSAITTARMNDPLCM